MVFLFSHSTTSAIACRPTLAALPEELIVKILELCDFKGVLACQWTCRALRDVIAGSTSLRYKLALSEHGMCDGTSSDLNTAEKLELLTAYADAWQSFDTIYPKKADILVGWSSPIAISCNVMVFSRLSNSQSEIHQDKWNDDDAGVMTMMGPCLNLLVLRVPSALRRVEAAHWVLDLPGNAGDVCIDASQDLLVYRLDGIFYSCTLSSGVSHPLSKHGGYFGMLNGDWCTDVYNLCICGDFVGAVSRVYYISVWNWKTGQLVFDKLISGVNFSSFDFLDEHHILCPASTEDSIYVYDLRHSEQQEREPQNEKIGFLRFQLCLPAINRATTSRYIQLRRNALPIATGPLPDWSSLRDDSGIAPGAGSGPATPPFHADPHERLIVMRIATSPIDWGEEQFEIHVPARAFLDHFSAASATSVTWANRSWDDGGECNDEDNVGPPVVPWMAWRNAVRVTPPRKLPYTVPARMIVYGMRAMSYPPDWLEGVFHVDSYLPRARRRESSGEVGAGTRARAAEAEPVPGARGYGTRQAIRLPREVEDKPGFLTALCEDALLFYKVDLLSMKMSHAFWYTF